MNSSNEKRGRYTSTQIPAHTRNSFGRLAAEEKKKGIKFNVTRESINASAQCIIPERTLREWREKSERGLEAISSHKISGRQPILNDRERDLLRGFILTKNQQNEEVHLDTVVKAIKDYFGKETTLCTAMHFLHKQCFAVHKARTRPAGYKLSTPQQASACAEWLNTEKAGGFFDCSLEQLCCVDCSYSSHRNEQHHTYSLIGR